MVIKCCRIRQFVIMTNYLTDKLFFTDDIFDKSETFHISDIWKRVHIDESVIEEFPSLVSSTEHFVECALTMLNAVGETTAMDLIDDEIKDEGLKTSLKLGIKMLNK